MKINRYTHKFDKYVFDILNEESCYWLGFLMADGSVSNVRNNFSINLKLSDISHLEKFKTFLKATNKVRIIGNKYKSCKIDINDKYLKEKLGTFGIIPNKSKNGSILNETLKLSKDFWRGYFDGDGSLGKYFVKNTHYWNIHVVGTKSIMEDFKNFVHLNIRSKANIVKLDNENYYHFGLKHKNARNLIKILYKNSSVYLDRKYLLAKNCMMEELDVKC
jgi:hypothetical protein